MSDRPIPGPESSNLQTGPSSESDLGALAALFAAHSGGNFSAEVSADLALEIVLNEIVEQACLATGATGAAIILERDGEMVCRASSGANAPEMGSRPGSERGLTAECIRMWQVQRCEDAQADPRADAEASRSLGVRSVMVLPLLRHGGLAGVLEVFSSRAGAFGDRDELTLEALAQRILKNLERASQAIAATDIPAATVVATGSANLDRLSTANELEDSREGPSTSMYKEDEVAAEIFGRTPRAGFNVVTFALSAAVVACAVLLAMLVGLRVNSRKTAGVRGQGTNAASGGAGIEQKAAARDGATRIGGQIDTSAVSPSSSSEAETSSVAVSEQKNPLAPDKTVVRSNDSFPPEGGLSVYENGKEIFRMPPVAAEVGTRVQRASSVEPAGVDGDPGTAAGSLLLRVEPEYPETARQQGIQGPVVLDVRIGRDGLVQAVKLVSGQALLANAAVAAVKQWRFKPQVLKGLPVEMQTRVTLNFKSPT